MRFEDDKGYLDVGSTSTKLYASSGHLLFSSEMVTNKNREETLLETVYHYRDDGTTLDFTRDSNGCEVHYMADGKTVDYSVTNSGFVHRNIVGPNNELLWVKQAKEKADKQIVAHTADQKGTTATALKVQKESQLVQNMREKEITAKNGNLPWVEAARNKMSKAIAEQKSKAKKTAPKTKTKGNEGNS